MAADEGRWRQLFRDAPPEPGDEQVSGRSHAQLLVVKSTGRLGPPAEKSKTSVRCELAPELAPDQQGAGVNGSETCAKLRR